MLVDVVEGLLNDPVKGRFHGSGKPHSIRRFNGNLQPRTMGHTFRKKLEGTHQSQIIQDGGPQLMRKVPQLLIDVIEMLFDVLEPPARAGIQGRFSIRSSEM